VANNLQTPPTNYSFHYTYSLSFPIQYFSVFSVVNYFALLAKTICVICGNLFSILFGVFGVLGG